MIELPAGLKETDGRHYVIDAAGAVIAQCSPDDAAEIARALNMAPAALEALAGMLELYHDHARPHPDMSPEKRQRILRAARALTAAHAERVAQ